MQYIFSYFYFFILILIIPSFKSLYSCLDESGNGVDYWIVITGSGSSYYYYYDENSNVIQFTKSIYLVNQTNKGAIMRTVNQIYSFSSDENIALGMYSDEPPGDSTASSTYAHSKGVLLSDTTQGFWLTHSKPNWPASRNTSLGLNAAIAFPDDTYAQHLMCITINSSMANNIAKGLYIDRTKIYSSYYTSSIVNTMPSFYSWIQQSAKSSITNSTFTIFTTKGNKFVQFAKSKEWDKDLWDDFVAPYYKVPMNVETWINGAGGRMSSACGTYSILTYDIYQVNNVIMGDLITWTNTQDHSKWGVSANTGSTKVACVGDINRMCSQESRGGGVLCFTDDNAWNIFNNIIASVESCYLYNPCTGISTCYWCSDFFLPSYSPTSSPYPTFKPSKVPSYKPSKSPSNQPSRKPTGPSFIPSVVPSYLPSYSPSTTPSDIPSDIPSVIPTTATVVPTSDLTTFSPSNTAISTTMPSTNFSTNEPLYLPTMHPSIAPSNASVIPSIKSSATPTALPSFNPNKNTQLVFLSSTQLLININISSITFPKSNYVSFTNGFIYAITKVLEKVDIPMYTFTIDSIIDVPSNNSRKNKIYYNRVLYTLDEVKVVYTLQIVLEDTKYQNSNDLATSVTDTIMISCNDSSLLSLFKLSGDPNLGNVTQTVLLNKFTIINNSNDNDGNDNSNTLFNGIYFIIGVSIGIVLLICICCPMIYFCLKYLNKNDSITGGKSLNSREYNYNCNDTFEYSKDNAVHNPVIKHNKASVISEEKKHYNKKYNVELKNVHI